MDRDRAAAAVRHAISEPESRVLGARVLGARVPMPQVTHWQCLRQSRCSGLAGADAGIIPIMIRGRERERCLAKKPVCFIMTMMQNFYHDLREWMHSPLS